MGNALRIDKYLWAVRIFKTRTLASDACKKGKVLINDNTVKPSRIIKIGEEIVVKKNPIFYRYRVKGLLGKRQSAKIVVDFIEDITPEKEYNKLKGQKLTGFEVRDRGVGRPTKKERRLIDEVKRKNL
ncbi:MAG: S4 domain-containing protein [Bacteroidales bacterium]|jgi:ribosome-associated heat shock protein Hsp15|nr:S4 domain-containing protein [Bacteroidales bacterium]